MPLPALLPLVIQAVAASGAIPEVLGALAGSKAKDAADRVVEVAKAISGKKDPHAAVTAVMQNPELQAKLEEALIAERIRYAELAAADRANARSREIQTGDKTARNLAYLILGAFVAMVLATLFGYSKVDSALAGALIGYLSAKAEQVVAFYYGSSAGSKAKDELLRK